LDYFFESDEEMTPMESMPSPVRMPVKRRGSGSEAMRASRYRQYDASTSPIYRFLQHDHAIVTRALLTELIEAVVRYTPEQERPRPPSRDQRRAKNGLVMWLDYNSEKVWRYLKEKFPLAVTRMAHV
jgi:hypothetical protein